MRKPYVATIPENQKKIDRLATDLRISITQNDIKIAIKWNRNALRRAKYRDRKGQMA